MGIIFDKIQLFKVVLDEKIVESNKRKKNCDFSEIHFVHCHSILTFCDINLQTTTMLEFRDLLKEMWFSYSDGFKHVFVGELTS